MSSQELEEDQWGWGLFGEQYDFPDGSKGRVVRFGRMFRESYMGVAKIVDAVEMEGSSHRASRRVVMEDPTREGFIRSAKKLPDGRVLWNVDVVELPALEIAIPAIKVQLQKRGIDLKEVMARGERIHLAHRDRQRPTIT